MIHNYRDEISFNLNSAEKDRPLQELTLDDLNDQDLKTNDKYWKNSNNEESKKNHVKQIQIFEQNNLQNHRQNFKNFDKYFNQEYGNIDQHKNSDLKKYQPKEDQPKTINFDTATFENEDIDIINNNRYNKQLNIQNNLGLFSQSQDSDFDLSDTKLKRLGIVNSIKKDTQEYSNLLNNYSKQFKDSHTDSTRLSDQQTTSHNATSYQINNSYNNNSHSNNNNYYQGIFSKENSRNVFDKYGHMLQRESQQPANPNNFQYNNNNKNRDIQENIQSINYKIKQVYQEFSNTNENYNAGGFAPCSSQNSNSDPYRISINSFKNSLFSTHQKENNSYLPNNNGLNTQKLPSSMGAVARDEIINNNLSSYTNLQGSYQPGRSYQPGMDSDSIMRSALQAHHLATSGQKQDQFQKPPKNHPVHNLNKVFGETSTMHNEFKKRSTSVIGDEDQLSTNKQTQTTTLASNVGTGATFEPTPFQKYMDSKKKYYDSFLSEKDKIMNNPLKLLKFKIQQRDKQTLDNCKSTLKYIDDEISSNVNPELENSVYQKSSYNKSLNKSSYNF